MKALQWFIRDCGEMLTAFSLAGQTELCSKLGETGLEEIFRTLQEVEELILSNCGLSIVPDISILSNLSRLDISHNTIKELPLSVSHNNIVEILLQGNPLETINVEHFPNLKYLTCGCSKKWQIDPRTLRKVAQKEMKLTFKVPDEFRNTLQFTPYEVLIAGANSIKKSYRQ